MNSKFVISSSLDITVKVWDLLNKRLPFTFNNLEISLGNPLVAVTPNFEFIVAPSGFRNMQILSTRTKKRVHLFHATEDCTRTQCLRSLPDSRYIISGSANRIIKIWDTRSKKLVQNKHTHQDNITLLAISQDSMFIVCGWKSGEIGIFSVESSSSLSWSSLIACSYSLSTKLSIYVHRNIAITFDP